jgi:hypothetical protein
MDNRTRIALFWGVCIPLRLGLAYVPTVLNGAQFDYVGAIVGAMACGTLYLAGTNNRLRAPEGGGRTWWAPYRFVHGFLLLAAAVYLFRRDRRAYVPLLVDVLLGAALFLSARVA